MGHAWASGPFLSEYGETALNDALLIMHFVQSLKWASFTWYAQL